jgi:hypothetical protein
MELKCLRTYSSAKFSIYPEQTTEGMDLNDKQKETLLRNFPHKFEKIGGAASGGNTLPEGATTKEGDEGLVETKEQPRTHARAKRSAAKQASE